MTSRAILVCLSGLLAFGSTACVETAAYEKTAAELDQARRVVAYKDQQIQAFQWQLAVLGQQFREAQQRSEAQQRELAARLQQLGEMNAGLASKLKETEAHGQPFEAEGEPLPKAAARPDDMRRLIAAVDARNAQLAESLARIERLLLGRGAPRAEGSRREDDVARKARDLSGDLVDPWGFGSRK
jgi:hypothetical protein